MSDHASLCSLTINNHCFNKDTRTATKKNSYEQEPPLITICGNFQVGGVIFFPAYDYEFIVFWKSFEY